MGYYNKFAASFFKRTSVAPFNVALASNGSTATQLRGLDEFFGSDYAPSKAIDGVQGDPYYWANYTLPNWLQVDFGVSRTITDIYIYMQAPPYGPGDFELQYWDGSAWQTINSYVGNGFALIHESFSPIVTQKIRCYFTAGQSDQYCRTYELEAWGT